MILYGKYKLHDVISAEYVDGYSLRIGFDDGKVGVIDLTNELWGPVFEPLLDVEYFKKVKVDPELGTICWPNGADIAPEFLYENIQS